MKLDETTVTSQPTNPSSPIMTTADVPQHSMGSTTHRRRRKIMPRVATSRPAIPKPKATRSFRMNETMSSTIIGTPPRNRPAESR